MSSLDIVEVISGISYIIYSVIACVIVPRHLYKSFIRLGENITKPDRLAQVLRGFSVFMYLVTLIIGAVLRNFWYNPPCLQTLLMMVIIWKIAQGFEYLAYVQHLYEVYPDPKIGYPTSTLWGVAYLIIGISGLFTILNITAIATIGILDADNDDKFPYKCQYTLDVDNYPTTVIPLGLGMIIWDAFLAFAAIFAYQNSYKRASDGGGYDPENKYEKELLQHGKKYKVIVTASCTAKLIWILLALFGLIDAAGIFASTEFFIAMVGLMVMTSNYSHDQWFKILCCCCIKLDPDLKDKLAPNVLASFSNETLINQQQKQEKEENVEEKVEETQQEQQQQQQQQEEEEDEVVSNNPNDNAVDDNKDNKDNGDGGKTNEVVGDNDVED